MKFNVVLLSVVIIHAQAWKVNYPRAKQILSPNFDHGRQNHTITCKISFFFLSFIYSFVSKQIKKV
jgi:hypothetical protein